MDPRFDVELVSVTKRYGEAVAVDAISLRVPEGTAIAACSAPAAAARPAPCA